MFSAINECMEENDCDDMAKCEDTLYTYTCKCTHVGFTGTGKACLGQNKQLNSSIYRESRIKCPATLLNIYVLLTEFEVRTVSYGPNFFPSDLWPKREARGP